MEVVSDTIRRCLAVLKYCRGWIYLFDLDDCPLLHFILWQEHVPKQRRNNFLLSHPSCYKYTCVPFSKLPSCTPVNNNPYICWSDLAFACRFPCHYQIKVSESMSQSVIRPGREGKDALQRYYASKNFFNTISRSIKNILTLLNTINMSGE